MGKMVAVLNCACLHFLLIWAGLLIIVVLSVLQLSVALIVVSSGMVVSIVAVNSERWELKGRCF